MAVITGTNGNDANLNGTPDDDEIYGLDGNDTLRGFGGNDLLDGGNGADSFFGGDGEDRIYGQAGNDTLRGEAGNDFLYGGDGADVLVGGFGDDLIDGGAGGDRASYNTGATGPVTIDLRLQGFAQNTGSFGFDTLVGIEHVSGTNFDDVLIGNDGDNFLWGGPGATGNDTISGGAGDDFIMTGKGNHVLDGGGGSGDIWSLYGNGSTVDMPGGVTASLALQGTAQDTGQGIMTVTGFEHMHGTLFNDTLIGDGGDNILAGGEAGSDHLIGGEGNDVLLGDGFFLFFDGVIQRADYANTPFTHGNDVLEGGEGHDTLLGGEGDDVLSGGEGHDRFVFGGTTFFGGRAVGAGHDRITDFQKKDIIELDFAGVDDMSDLHIVEAGNNLLITWGSASDSITLENFKAKHLSAANFDFGADALATAQSASSLISVISHHSLSMDLFMP